MSPMAPISPSGANAAESEPPEHDRLATGRCCCLWFLRGRWPEVPRTQHFTGPLTIGTSISWSRWMRWVARRCGLRCRISKSSDWQESHAKSERKTEHDSQIRRDHAPAEYTVESGHQAHSDAQEQASEGIGKNVFGSGGLHVPPPRSLGRTRTGLVNLEMPNTEIMTSPTMIKMNASHHRGLRPGLSITLTEITPVHTAPPTPATLKPTSYLPGSVTGSIELGVNAPANEVLP